MQLGEENQCSWPPVKLTAQLMKPNWKAVFVNDCKQVHKVNELRKE